MNFFKYVAILTVMLTVVSQAHAGSYCEQQYSSRIGAVQAKFRPELLSLEAEIKRLRAASVDPTRYVVEFEGKWVPITYKFGMLFDRFEKESANASGKAEGCEKAVAPAQLAADIGVLLATNGLSLILPDRVTHIDMGQVINGKPFGDDNAFVPKFRDDVIGVITGDRRDNGFISNFARDPIQCMVFAHPC
jgi:hypothetical protein